MGKEFFFLEWGEQEVVFYMFLKKWIQLIYKIEEQENSGSEISVVVS